MAADDVNIPGMNDIERRLSVAHQQYLSTQTKELNRMMGLHEQELILVWVALTVLSLAMMYNFYLLGQHFKDHNGN